MAPIPIELLSAGRELTEPRLSPAGDLVAFVERRAGGSAVVVVPSTGGPERAITSVPAPAPGRGLGGGCFDWLPDGRGIVYVAVDGELWLQPLDAGPRQLTAWERSCRAPAVAPSGGFAVCAVDEAEIWLVPLGAAGPRAAGDTVVDRQDDGGARRLDDGADGFCFDPAVAPDSAAVAWQAWSAPSMPWDDATMVVAVVDGGAVVRRWRPPDGAVQQPRILDGGTYACVHDGSGWLNVAIGDHPIVPEPFEHAAPTWGMGQRSYAVAPDGRRVAFTRNEAGFGRLCIAERGAAAPADGEGATEPEGANRAVAVRDVGRGVHGQLSWRGDSLVALRSGARTATQVVRYDGDGTRTALAVGPPLQWDSIELAEPDVVEVDRAGTTLHARRYAAGGGRMLCWVHGGPTDQWQVEFRPRIAYWWSRGWDVLVVDPRGSTGHGRAYRRALNGSWGRLDVDDTAALIAAAHEAGWATPATTVALGGSSGGLTVLGLLADHPALVAGGIASYPVSDLAALADTDHRFEAHYGETLVGPAADGARYAELSPLGRADRIAGPLLVFHGTDDPVVPIEQSERLVERIRAGGGHVELVVYDGEGHGFRDPANQLDEYRRTERFLDAIAP